LEEANAELANLAAFRSFAHAAGSIFRIRLAIAAMKKQGALDVARSRTLDLPLTHRDELLCDILEAIEGDGVDQDEWARIDGELRDDVKLAAWIEHLVPGARARLSPRQCVVDLEEAAEEEALHALSHEAH
jgi:hypothetical protein